MSNFKIAEQEVTVVAFSKAAYRKASQTPPKERDACADLLVQVDYRTMAFPVLLLPNGQYKRIKESDMIIQFENGNLDVVSEAEFKNFTGGFKDESEKSGDTGNEKSEPEKVVGTPVSDTEKAAATTESAGTAKADNTPDSCAHKCDEHGSAGGEANPSVPKAAEAKPAATEVKADPNPVASISGLPGTGSVKKYN